MELCPAIRASVQASQPDSPSRVRNVCRKEYRTNGRTPFCSILAASFATVTNAPLCCFLRLGYSRFLVHWDLRERMTEADIEIVLERAKEQYPGVKPRIISDNGPQFIAKDFKEFIRISGMTHVRTSPYYPQSNGKIERWHKSLKGECIRPGTPLSLEDARRLVQGYVEHYNNVRLNSAIGYIAPKDMLAGHQQEIQAERDRKLEAARKQRQIRRQQAA